MNLADLRKPFPPDRISWRVGSTNAAKDKGMALAYIDARDVQDRLDEVCGVENWQCRFPHANGKTVCEIGIRFTKQDLAGVHSEWVWKADGAGDSDIEAEKGALSDAFKRAAVKWGVGRYLYDLDSPWVAIENKRIKESEYPRLRALLTKNGTNGSHKPSEAALSITDPDIAQGMRNWVDQQKDIIINYSDLDKLTAWLKKHATYGNREGTWDRPTPSSTLDKILKHDPKMFNELKSYYMEKMREI